MRDRYAICDEESHDHSLYKALFGAVANSEAAQKSVARRRKLIDFLHGDIRRINASLAAPERMKLEALAESLDPIIARDRWVTSHADRLRAEDPGPPVDISTVDGRTEAMFRLATAALVCEMTHVVNLSVTPTNKTLAAVHSGIGYTKDNHELCHGGPGRQTDPVMGDSTAIRNSRAERWVQLFDKLAATPEGDKTMFDNTVMVWINDNGGTHHASAETPWPAVVVGTAGGRLRPGGKLRDVARGRSVLDLYRTLAHAAGAPPDGFARGSEMPARGELADLIA